MRRVETNFHGGGGRRNSHIECSAHVTAEKKFVASGLNNEIVLRSVRTNYIAKELTCPAIRFNCKNSSFKDESVVI